MLVLLATPVLASALLLNPVDHHRLTSFFLPLNWTRSNQIQVIAGGGYPVSTNTSSGSLRIRRSTS